MEQFLQTDSGCVFVFKDHLLVRQLDDVVQESHDLRVVVTIFHILEFIFAPVDHVVRVALGIVDGVDCFSEPDADLLLV